MELRVLNYFLEIAREGNMTHAANRLHVSQSTLSRQIKDLERELGKPLFVRSNHNIKLTEEGMLLRKRAEDILDMSNKTIAEFKALDEEGGEIRIGCAESRGITPFIKVIKEIQEKHPRIRYSLYSSGTDTIDERLDRGLLDFAIIIQDVDLQKYNFLKIPSEDQWGLIMRHDNPLAAKESICLEDILEEPLILSRQAMNKEMSRWFGKALGNLDVVATYDLLFNASLMVREGFGSVIGLGGLVDTNQNSELCFRPLKPQLESPLYIIWRKYQIFTPAGELLLKELKATFNEEQ